MSPLLLRRLSDESLGSRLASGEAAAFDELYRRYAHRLAAYGAQLLGDAASGDDVAQASLIKAYVALREGRLPARVKPWLYRIAHNCAVDSVARRRELPLGGLPDRPAPTGAAGAGELVAAFAALPDRQRHVYVLRELHGLRIDETASEPGLAPAQVEQALFAARNRLAELLVFGERLSCVAVRRLAGGPLDADERRALKTHLRSCEACRQSVGATGALGILPVGVAGWLRALPALLAGGGSPAAVKIGAVVATATLATGAPIAYEVTKPVQPRHVAAPIVDQARPKRHAPPARVVVPPRSTAAVVDRKPAIVVAYHARRVVRVEPAHATADDAEHQGDAVPVVVVKPRHDDGSGDDHHSDDGGADPPVAPVVTPEPVVPSGGGQDVPVTTTAQGGGSDDGSSTSDGDGGPHQDGMTGPGSSSGGGDGGSGGQDGSDSGGGGTPSTPDG